MSFHLSFAILKYKKSFKAVMNTCRTNFGNTIHLTLSNQIMWGKEPGKIQIHSTMKKFELGSSHFEVRCKLSLARTLYNLKWTNYIKQGDT